MPTKTALTQKWRGRGRFGMVDCKTNLAFLVRSMNNIRDNVKKRRRRFGVLELGQRVYVKQILGKIFKSLVPEKISCMPFCKVCLVWR